MTTFAIDSYSPSYLSGMIDLHNRLTAFEPHIVPLTPDLFAALVAAKPWFDPAGLCVAHENGRVVGWVHACVATGTEPWSPHETVYHIRMLLFSPDRMDVGRALVHEATAWLQSHGGRHLMAFHPSHGYPFYRGLWLGGEPALPYSLPAVHMVLDNAGYKTAAESIYMVGKLDAPPPQEPLADDVELIEEPVLWATNAMRISWEGFNPQSARAYINSIEVGQIGWVTIPHTASTLGSPTVNIWGLGIDESYRRKRLASALTALAYRSGYEAGARVATVCTQLWNAPAQGVYARFGCVPYVVIGGRVLEVS